MQFMMKEGVLYTSDFHKALVKMKSTLLGPQKKICKISGDLLLVASIKSPDTTETWSGAPTPNMQTGMTWRSPGGRSAGCRESIMPR